MARWYIYTCLSFCSQGVCLSACWDTTPRTRHPPGADPPGPGTPPPPSMACCEIRSTSGRYASYWNAILLKQNFEDISPFCRATDTPVLDFWWCLLWVSKPGLILHLRATSPVYNRILTFTSGAIPADLFFKHLYRSCKDSSIRPLHLSFPYFEYNVHLIQLIR